MAVLNSFLRPKWRFGVRSGSVQGLREDHSGFVRGPFGIRAGSVWGPFGVRSESVRGPCGGPFGVHAEPAAAAMPAQMKNFWNLKFWFRKFGPKIGPNGSQTKPERIPNGPRTKSQKVCRCTISCIGLIKFETGQVRDMIRTSSKRV